MHDSDRKKGGYPLGWRAILIVLTLGGVLCAPAVQASDSAANAATRLAGLETQAGILQQTLAGLTSDLSAFLPPRAVTLAEAPRLMVAQARDPAALAVRLDQLEEQMRTLNGQVEGLQFQLTQLQTLLERMQQDTDARFSAVEGGVAPGKTEAAPQGGGATPAAETPQALDLNLPADGAAADSGGMTTTDGGGGATDPSSPSDAPIELGAPEHPLGTLTLDQIDGAAANGGEVDISQNAGLVSDADADAQYKAGYDAVVKGDYAFAEDQFRQFIALFPDHPQAPDATNWLGEALIQRGDFEGAADILLTGFQTYANTSRGPDILMKLGIALNGTGEQDTACRTFGEVLRRYPDLTPAFKLRLTEEQTKAKC